MKRELQISQLGAITYTRSIMEYRTGRTVKRFKQRRNLITDQGLDALVTNSWVSSFDYLVLGTGTAPFKRDSGLVTFTRSGNNVVASSNFFLNTDTGSLLKWDSGEECYITYGSATTATSNISGTIGAGEATLYHVNRVGLQTEVKRTNTMTTDSGDAGYSWNGATGTLSIWRTLIASAEVGTVTYRELAWSHSGASGNNIFGGDLVAGGGDVLVAGQQYKVKIQLDLVISGTTASAAFAALTPPAWPAVSGNFQNENVGIYGGSIGTPWTGGVNEPNFAGQIKLYTGADALRSPNGAGNNGECSGGIASANLSADSYTGGSFTRTFRASFPSTAFSSTAIRSIAHVNTGWNHAGYRLLLSADESKSSAQALNDLIIRKTWGRVLVN